MPDASRDPAVPLADVEVAQRIAAAAREGGPAERTPTVAQLLTAFGEDETGGPAAVGRVQRALALAGVAVSPPLDQAPPGSRVTLSPGRGPGGGGPRGVRALVLGAVALVAVIVGVVLAAGALGGSDEGGGRASSLPAGPTTTTTPGADATTPVTTTTTTSTTATGPTDAEKAAAERQAQVQADAEAKAKRERKAAARAAAARRKADKAAAERRKAAKEQLTVRFVPAEPSFACIDDGAGKQLFSGTLSSRLTLKAKKLRLNIGLKTVAVSVDGKRLALTGSPSGYLLQVGKAPQYLPLGARPSC